MVVGLDSEAIISAVAGAPSVLPDFGMFYVAHGKRKQSIQRDFITAKTLSSANCFAGFVFTFVCDFSMNCLEFLPLSPFPP